MLLSTPNKYSAVSLVNHGNNVLLCENGSTKSIVIEYCNNMDHIQYSRAKLSQYWYLVTVLLKKSIGISIAILAVVHLLTNAGQGGTKQN